MAIFTTVPEKYNKVESNLSLTDFTIHFLVIDYITLHSLVDTVESLLQGPIITQDYQK